MQGYTEENTVFKRIFRVSYTEVFDDTLQDHSFAESNSCNHLILLWRRMACFALISVVYVSYFQVCEAEISFFLLRFS